MLALLRRLEVGGALLVLFSVVDFFLLCSDKITGQTFDLDPGTFAYTRKEAVGVCGQIIPW
jgi:acyl-CoA reductase-like NAD-dependent aldehyde dehydrogenase